MQTTQKIIIAHNGPTGLVAPDEVALVVTSPPYPIVAQWDDGFSAVDGNIGAALADGDGWSAFALMHDQLDEIWRECHGVLMPGGIMCVNIGDAVRTFINGPSSDGFQVYPNHSRVIRDIVKLPEMVQLPSILWHKPSNSPSAFLGSGMLPPGAYVTHEHEWILIFRKGEKRVFITEEEKSLRRESAYFFEERNEWFSNVWTIPGVNQTLADGSRSAAFPYELAHRLVNAYSIKGDTVYDPFCGTGTTLMSSLSSGRHGIGIECNQRLLKVIMRRLKIAALKVNERNAARLDAHRDYVLRRVAEGGKLRYHNVHYGFPVVSSQEKNLFLNNLSSIESVSPKTITVGYEPTPTKEVHT